VWGGEERGAWGRETTREKEMEIETEGKIQRKRDRKRARARTRERQRTRAGVRGKRVCVRVFVGQRLRPQASQWWEKAQL